VATSPDAAASDAPVHLFVSRRRQFFGGRRAQRVSVISSVVVLGGLALTFYFAPGGATFRYYFLHPSDMWRSFVGDPAKGLSAVGRGMLTNIWMFLVCEALVLVFGLLIAWVRITASAMMYPFRLLATLYTDVLRGLPIILVILMVGYGVPALQLGWISNQSLAVYGCAVLTMSYSAYVAEVFRAGIYSVPHGQLLAARSLGLTHAATMRRVILPQAVRTVVAPLLNDFISLQKDTALVSTLGAIEVLRAAGIYASTVFNFSGYTVAALLFLALTIPMTRYTDGLMARDRARRLAGAS
jgi:polar amino acid transport system permease protein